MQKILLAITTGRSIFRQTLDMLVVNFTKYGNFEKFQVDLLINYDSSFLGVHSHFFRYQNAMFNKIIYLSPESVTVFKREMRSLGLSDREINIICQPYGFGNKKNLILWTAIKGAYDVVLFWDDDEYPVIYRNDGKTISWHHTDILGAHIGQVNNIYDVATGFWSGHIFPIYPPLVEDRFAETSMKLGTALALGTETHSASSFINLTKSLESSYQISSSKEIVASGGGKWVSGGNISLRVQQVISGIIPPFYTPRDSRGDDTIFSTALAAARVYLVPSGAFHDMYLEYLDITEGVYPERVVFQPQHSKIYLNRFVLALKAWLAYAPLLIRIRSANQYESILEEMVRLLTEVDATLFIQLPELSAALGEQHLASLLQHYASFSQHQLEEVGICYEAWDRVCSMMR